MIKIAAEFNDIDDLDKLAEVLPPGDPPNEEIIEHEPLEKKNKK